MFTRNKETTKTVLIGWDGAIPQVIKEMIAKGKLPHIYYPPVLAIGVVLLCTARDILTGKGREVFLGKWPRY